MYYKTFKVPNDELDLVFPLFRVIFKLWLWKYYNIFFLQRKGNQEGWFYLAVAESFMSIGWKIFQNGASFIEPLWRWEALRVLCYVWFYIAAQWPEVLPPCHLLPHSLTSLSLQFQFQDTLLLCIRPVIGSAICDSQTYMYTMLL